MFKNSTRKIEVTERIFKSTLIHASIEFSLNWDIYSVDSTESRESKKKYPVAKYCIGYSFMLQIIFSHCTAIENLVRIDWKVPNKAELCELPTPCYPPWNEILHNYKGTPTISYTSPQFIIMHDVPQNTIKMPLNKKVLLRDRKRRIAHAPHLRVRLWVVFHKFITKYVRVPPAPPPTQTWHLDMYPPVPPTDLAPERYPPPPPDLAPDRHPPVWTDTQSENITFPHWRVGGNNNIY